MVVGTSPTSVLAYAHGGGDAEALRHARHRRHRADECLDWILIWNRRHLEHVLTDYIRHYNTARPHRGIDLDVLAVKAAVSDASARWRPRTLRNPCRTKN